jgi:glyoxylase-like metal-dependent hydrolase (beta-lactamase superfamily II)
MVKARDFEYVDPQERVIVIYDVKFPLYIVRGRRNFLIDSGAAARGPASYANINRALAASGDGEDTGIQTLLLTHTHWDHTGASYYLQQRYRFDVYASRWGVELLQKKKVIALIDRLNQDYKKMVKDTSDAAFGQLENLNPVKEGDRIPAGEDSYFEVFETPGHTKCSVAYLLHPQRILFPGDAVGVLEQAGSVRPLFLSSYTRYEQSLERLIQLDAEALAFSHNRCIKGKDRVKAHLRDSLAWTRHVKDVIIDLLQDEDDIPKVAEKLLHQEFPRTRLMGTKEAMVINLEAMVKSVKHECLGIKK